MSPPPPTPHPQTPPPQTHPSTTVLIIGAGFAGLTAAIECVLHGHAVTLLESFATLAPLGDIISFGHNAGRVFRRWPGGVEGALDAICHRSEELVFNRFDGEHLMTQVWEEEGGLERGGGKKFNGHRGEIHRVVWGCAVGLGVDIRLGRRVCEYFEDAEEAGVVVEEEDGEGEDEGGRKRKKRTRYVADVVLAADGVRSTARAVVLGQEDKPKSSGYAIWRAWFPSDELARDPLTRHLVVNGDTHTGWLGPDVHFLAASIKNGTSFSWVCTHKDTDDVVESWSAPGSITDALALLDGWSPTVRAIVRHTPPDRLVDWKLVYRDPLPTWVSPSHGRIALLGDAAHPFLPTSIQGASQAVEDGVTIAVCLELAAKEGGGKGDVREALLAYERMRYERVRAAQKTGETTRDRWHKADFEKVKEEPKAIKLPREEWLLGHDAEAHAYAVGFVLGAFKSNLKEASTKRFVFENSSMLPYLNRDHDVVNRMVEPMCCGTYIEDDKEEAIDKTVCRHIDLSVLADYYMVDGLTECGMDRVRLVLDDWKEVKSALSTIISAAYGKLEPTVSSIRARIIDIVAVQLGELKTDKVFCDFLKTLGEFCTDVMCNRNSKRPDVTRGIRTWCEFCNKKNLWWSLLMTTRLLIAPIVARKPSTRP
ncbi:salicylate hydroxylase [Diplodia corticola]|uniref:Salicylate hydroxylase n=1 Tax=Diplodia corticola TaxID=236234 RepID=A0A1J9QV91_9PEZI|nr:salicylate hydroxylase [Diplodia corticola]OJD32344.1 salicylate hydroxylase [Diplodia corticola]